jgi:phosphoesterase RecJ-like protein
MLNSQTKSSFPLNQSDIDKLSSILSRPIKIVVTSHYNPDGDAVGSAMAVYHLLNALNHQVYVIFPNSFPSFLSWICGSEKVLVFDQNQLEAQQLIERADLIFCLDYNALSRVGDMEPAIRNAGGLKIIIDHHPNPDFSSFNFQHHNTSASSTAELVYVFFKLLKLDQFIDKYAAESLYAGIITDTGSLSFSCNNPETYHIIADLIAKGLDAERAHRLIYDNFSEERMRLMGFSIYQKMIVIENCHTALIPLGLDELEKFHYQQGDTESIVNYPLSIKTINLSILLTQRKDKIRLSFRSKGVFPVNEIAARYFEGGGHRNAAGGDSFVSMDETIEKIKEILPLYCEQLNFEIQ